MREVLIVSTARTPIGKTYRETFNDTGAGTPRPPDPQKEPSAFSRALKSRDASANFLERTR